MAFFNSDNVNFLDEALFSGLDTALSYAIGVFETNGTIVYTNAGMKRILSTKNGEESLDKLINPSWKQVVEAVQGNTKVFDGIFTFEVAAKSYEALKGTAQSKAEQILLIAEYELAEMSKGQTSLNGEVANLQRELSIKNSQLEQAISKLEESETMLIHSEKLNAMGQLLAAVAHEINNPISFVSSNLRSLETMTKDLLKALSKLEQVVESSQVESLRKSVAQIHEEADIDFIVADLDDLLTTSLDGLKSVQKIVAELSNFSRLDKAEAQVASVGEGIESSLALAHPALKNRIEIELDIAKDLPEIICRPDELNQVFLNLIINAAQAIQGAGHLWIKARADSEFITLEFTDDGVGMEADVQKNIFKPFFTTKALGSGTGLGLSIAHKIITEGHHGTISVDSRLGQGTSFLIKLPIKN